MEKASPAVCILGCGTMGRAILSGIFAGQDGNGVQPYTPRKFIACVSREESGSRVTESFNDRVTLLVRENVKGVEGADVVLLW